MNFHSNNKTKKAVQKAYGLVLGIIMRILLAFMTMGSQTVYVVVLGDTLPPLIRTVNQHILGGKIPEFFMNRYGKVFKWRLI